MWHADSPSHQTQVWLSLIALTLVQVCWASSMSRPFNNEYTEQAMLRLSSGSFSGTQEDRAATIQMAVPTLQKEGHSFFGGWRTDRKLYCRKTQRPAREHIVTLCTVGGSSNYTLRLGFWSMTVIKTSFCFNGTIDYPPAYHTDGTVLLKGCLGGMP